MMTIRQEIFNALALTKYTVELSNKTRGTDNERTSVPFILMSAPGYGKTTIIKQWCEQNGYHLETLIGSRFTPEEIMGYQVNEPGSKELVHKNPKWYSRLMEKHTKGIPTVLFADEVTATPMQTQGPFFDLIFSRTSGDGNRLPDDTLIIAAGNYALNLSTEHNVLSPLINRFCIINLQSGRSSLDVINEFLKKPENPEVKPGIEVTDELREKIADKVYDLWKKLIASYSDRDSANGVIDFQNQDFGNIYQDSENEMLNFWTGRTISNYSSLVEAMIANKMTQKEYIKLVTDGCGGNGTCTFANEEQRDKYRQVLANSTFSIINDVLTGLQMTKARTKTLNASTATIAELTQDFIMNKEMITDLFADTSDFITLYTKIVDKYSNVINTVKALPSMNEQQRAEFIADMDAIQELFTAVTPADQKEISQNLIRIHQDHLFIYAGLTGVSDNLADYKDVYGTATPRLIQKIKVVMMKKTVRSNPTFQKIGIRESNGSLFFPMGTETKGIEVSIGKSLSKGDVDYIVAVDAQGNIIQQPAM